MLSNVHLILGGRWIAEIIKKVVRENDGYDKKLRKRREKLDRNEIEKKMSE